MPALQGIGILLVVVALIALGIYLHQNSKAGKIRTVPFKKPSEIGQQGMSAGDAKQMISTEGQVTGQPLVAPMSGQPCLYYEIEIIRGFHKSSTNAQGHHTKTHSTKQVMEQKLGTIFGLTDGTGTVGVDCTKKPSFDLAQGHRSRQNIGLIVPGQVQFGQLRVQTEGLASAIVGALLGGGETTDYYEGVEKIVPYQQGQNLYALGKLAQGPQGPVIGDPGGMSSLMLSDKGREGALGTAVKNAKIAMIAGIVLFVGGAGTAIAGFVIAPDKPAKTADAASTSAATTASTSSPASTAAGTTAPASTHPAAPGTAHPAAPPPKKK
jgi:hypothetical protein